VAAGGGGGSSVFHRILQLTIFWHPRRCERKASPR